MAPLPPLLRDPLPSSHSFAAPAKRIQTHDDLPTFHASPAYALITSFISHLNSSVSPLDNDTNTLSNPSLVYTNNPDITISPAVSQVLKLLAQLSQLVEAAPPDSGPRRFGNVAYRTWFKSAEKFLKDDEKMKEYLSSVPDSAREEVIAYLVGSFGSKERLDYGTGHELSFAAFLCALWKLDTFAAGSDERALVLRAFDAYFNLVRKLVSTYTLEPAGSHGVWGLDDHFFLPYIFGSAQVTTYRAGEEGKETVSGDENEVRTAVDGLPKPPDVVKKDVVERERNRNLYFDAIAFVHEVKKGPFWEHSPVLFDISGVQKGWGKINEGMIKMYDKEVLGKFPVVQHFPFGSIFRWSDDPAINNRPAAASSHTLDSQPGATRAPWATASSQSTDSNPAATRAPWANSITQSKPGEQPLTTKAPWDAPAPPPFPTSAGMQGPLDTLAPWAMGSSTSPPLDTHSPPPPTEAALGPNRTSSPDSKMAIEGPSAERERRGSKGTGGVRVGETGDLSRGRVDADPTRRSPLQGLNKPGEEPVKDRSTWEAPTAPPPGVGAMPKARMPVMEGKKSWERVDEMEGAKPGVEAAPRGEIPMEEVVPGIPEKGEDVKGSTGQGGVVVGETGDLSKGRHG